MDLLGQHTGTLPFRISMPKTPPALIPGSRDLEHISIHARIERREENTLFLLFYIQIREERKKKTHYLKQPKAVTQLPKKQKHQNHYTLNSKICL